MRSWVKPIGFLSFYYFLSIVGTINRIIFIIMSLLSYKLFKVYCSYRIFNLSIVNNVFNWFYIYWHKRKSLYSIKYVFYLSILYYNYDVYLSKNYFGKWNVEKRILVVEKHRKNVTLACKIIYIKERGKVY